MYKNIIFDLDGTILDTLDDMLDAINEALKMCGYKYTYKRKNGKYLYGAGASTLVKRALEFLPNATSEDEKKLREVFFPLYKKYSNRKTIPYPDTLKLLLALKNRGYHLFVASNKPHQIATRCIEKYFGLALFDGVYGKKEHLPTKPDPALLSYIISTHELSPCECLYVGDSEIDVKFSMALNIPCVGASYGYRSRKELVKAGAISIISKPLDLLKFLVIYN